MLTARRRGHILGAYSGQRWLVQGQRGFRTQGCLNCLEGMEDGVWSGRLETARDPGGCKRRGDDGEGVTLEKGR